VAQHGESIFYTVYHYLRQCH